MTSNYWHQHSVLKMRVSVSLGFKMYITVQKFGVYEKFSKGVSYAHQGCICLIKNTVKTEIL